MQRFRHVAVLQKAPRNQGIVELAEDLLFHRLVAVKVMPIVWACESHEEFLEVHPGESEQPWRDIMVTFHLGATLGLGCVCEFLGLFRRQAEDGHELCMVMSYCAGGDLFTWLERNQCMVRTARERAAVPLMHRVVLAVRDIHAEGIGHGDLSLENVLLRDAAQSGAGPPRICVIDFGASTAARARGVRGKASYQAPEMHSGQEYDARVADMFSLGVMIFTLVAGDYPWRSTRPGLCPRFLFAFRRGIAALLSRQKVRCEDGEAVPLSSVFSPELVALLTGLLSLSPGSRLGVDAALRSPWFAMDVADPVCTPSGDSAAPSGGLAGTTTPQTASTAEGLERPGSAAESREEEAPGGHPSWPTRGVQQCSRSGKARVQPPTAEHVAVTWRCPRVMAAAADRALAEPVRGSRLLATSQGADRAHALALDAGRTFGALSAVPHCWPSLDSSQ